MDYLWTPWRYQYLKQGSQPDGCVFCRIAGSDEDETNLVVLRGEHNFVVLNRYPYTSGHILVVPYDHLATIEQAGEPIMEEMIRLTRRLEAALRRLYRPEGLNIGMNIGMAAGAGVAGHIHMHVLPRWTADANFATVIGETRVIPEELHETRRRLCAELTASDP